MVPYWLHSSQNKSSPQITPQPYSWGELTLNANAVVRRYFHISEVIEFCNSEPLDPSVIGPYIAELHHRSKSPKSHFGLHVPTHDGIFCQSEGWDPSWMNFFSRILLNAFSLD